MLGPDSEDERFVLELVRNWYAELNPRVRCAFGNVSIFPLASICEYFTGSCFLLNSAFLSLSKQVIQRSETKSGFFYKCLIFSILYISVETRIM